MAQQIQKKVTTIETKQAPARAEEESARLAAAAAQRQAEAHRLRAEEEAAAVAKAQRSAATKRLFDEQARPRRRTPPFAGGAFTAPELQSVCYLLQVCGLTTHLASVSLFIAFIVT